MENETATPMAGWTRCKRCGVPMRVEKEKDHACAGGLVPDGSTHDPVVAEHVEQQRTAAFRQLEAQVKEEAEADIHKENRQDELNCALICAANAHAIAMLTRAVRDLDKMGQDGLYAKALAHLRKLLE